ncbi:MAG TPA: Gfo/Idh/MocA family oxidoreductase [Virgibacillus sp.]|nr:Gfo/Idh/MocA family oxidoreductase [Virgibacillus sp.]
MINVALLSRWHVHADDYAHQIQNIDCLSIKMVWDEDEARGKKWARELSVPFEQNLQNVLTDRSIDAVVINTPTNLHKEIIVSAAENKKHIFTEKVLAFTVEDCQEIYQTVDRFNVELMVSLPRLTDDYYVYAQKALDDGLIGELTTIRCRLAHNGAVAESGKTEGWLPKRFFSEEQTGGGSLIDLGAHPIYLTNRLAGKVKSLNARMQHINDLGVDDNASVLLEYENGALGIIETSFVSAGSPFQLELYGTKGTLLVEDHQIRIKSQLLDEDGWTVPDGQSEALSTPMEQWVRSIEGKDKPSIRRSDVLNLSLVNELAKTSDKLGTWMTVD